MDYRQRLLAVARGYCNATGLSLARVATKVHNHGAFFKRLEGGAGCTVDTYEKCLQWFSDNWPAGTKWPAGVMRPTRRKTEDAA